MSDESQQQRYVLTIRRGSHTMYVILAGDDRYMTPGGGWEMPQAWRPETPTKIGLCLETESFIVQTASRFDPAYDGRLPIGMCRSILYLPIETVEMEPYKETCIETSTDIL